MTRRAATLTNVGILAVTIVLVSLILTVGRGETIDVAPEIAIGRPSPETFIADRSTTPIEDEDATMAARDAAALSVQTIFTENAEATLAVLRDISGFYAALDGGAFDEPLPTTTTTTTQPTTTTTTAPEDGETTTTQVTTTTTTLPPTTTTTTLPRKDIEQQIIELQILYPRVQERTTRKFVELKDADLTRVAEGEASAFPEIEDKTRAQAQSELDDGVKPRDLDEVANGYLNPLTQPPIFIESLPTREEQETAREAISELIGQLLQANLVADEDATEAERQAQRDAVEPVTVVYRNGDTIVNQGETIDEIQFEAIDQLDLYQPETVAGPSVWAMALVGTIAVLLAAFFLWRIAPSQWSHPRHFMLLAFLLVLAAVISRMPDVIATDNHALGYLMPAVAIGFMAAILFDPRTAALLAVPMAGFTAISTFDVAFTVFAGVAVVIPVAFVSSVSSRRQLRLAVVYSAVALAPVAGALEWLFGPEGSNPFQAALLAALGGLVAGFIAMGLVSFLESAAGMTTSLTLLDLLDRNHPALRVLEEKAPGTFNHSMLVGSLAGRAARAIDADPLLAQAAAWYHDLGKTEHPQYFVENQFGVSNPHDDLAPERSAEIIRSHVTDGLRLARQYRIPIGVADGIRMHHGTSLMRYFYNKAYADDPTVDPELFRHSGIEPRQKEMAIVMISDAVEAAARSYAQTEDPTAEGLHNLVEAVVQEKLDDHQLAFSDLTFRDLTMVKAELVRALMGYYHTRVPYPGFPGPTPQRSLPASAVGLPAGEATDQNGLTPLERSAEIDKELREEYPDGLPKDDRETPVEPVDETVLEATE